MAETTNLLLEYAILSLSILSKKFEGLDLEE